MRWKWPWTANRTPSEETIEARQKLHEVRKDNAKLDAITKRTQDMMATNHLGSDIRRALGGSR